MKWFVFFDGQEIGLSNNNLFNKQRQAELDL